MNKLKWKPKYTQVPVRHDTFKIGTMVDVVCIDEKVSLKKIFSKLTSLKFGRDFCGNRYCYDGLKGYMACFSLSSLQEGYYFFYFFD